MIIYVVTVSDGQGGTQLVSHVLWRFGGRRLVIVGAVIIRGLVVPPTALLITTVRTLVVIIKLFIVKLVFGPTLNFSSGLWFVIFRC